MLLSDADVLIGPRLMTAIRALHVDAERDLVG
jgi:hypothetical protein